MPCTARHSVLCCAQDAIAAKRFVQTPSAEAAVRRRNLRDALHIAADVADVMVFLHSMDIIHGQLTPSAPCWMLFFIYLVGAAVALHAFMPAACVACLLPCCTREDFVSMSMWRCQHPLVVAMTM